MVAVQENVAEFNCVKPKGEAEFGQVYRFCLSTLSARRNKIIFKRFPLRDGEMCYRKKSISARPAWPGQEEILGIWDSAS